MNDNTALNYSPVGTLLVAGYAGQVVDNEMNAMFRRLVSAAARRSLGSYVGRKAQPYTKSTTRSSPPPAIKPSSPSYAKRLPVRLFGTCDAFLWDVTPP